MDSSINISDFSTEDLEALGTNIYDISPWTGYYLLSLGEPWINDSGNPDADRIQTLVNTMMYLVHVADAGLFPPRSTPLSSPLLPIFILNIQHFASQILSVLFLPLSPWPLLKAIPSQPSSFSPTGTSFQDFSADSDVDKPREPNSVIQNFLALSPAERCALGDHLRLWIKVVDQTPAEARDLHITAEHRRRFGMKLFDGWNTSHGASEVSEDPSPKTKEQSRILVSVWSEDLPLLAEAKRKRDDDDGKTPSPKKQKASPGRLEARKKGANAYIAVNKTVGKGDDKISFEMKDSKSQLATAEFVLMQHDSAEAKRTRIFNEKLIIATARNWIVEAANVGLESGSGQVLRAHPEG
ncbi:hypothetical protein NW768_003772 [Fusarium equiseti]|uniref:Uncharacterized protein n=1 Tax=Fusarium equiseti TaxID=61235 RepID=A0ABQ8RIK6_FUSEQ|nr:hypothetical protein NW768_003772 [Fusarium equiseti]